MKKTTPAKLAKKPAPKKAVKAPIIIGWREHVYFPEFSAQAFIAKIDTGAKSAALHADDIQVDGKDVYFSLGRERCRAKLHDLRKIKSSNGIVETRAVIKTEIHVGSYKLNQDVTLTDRTDMGVPVLIGRATIEDKFIVHPGKGFLLSEQRKTERPAKKK